MAGLLDGMLDDDPENLGDGNVIEGEVFDETDLGEGEGETSGAEGESEGADVPEYFLGELTSDEVLERLNASSGLPSQLKALESRAFGKMGSMEEVLKNLQKNVPTSVNFDSEKLAKIREYDPNLADAIAADLAEAVQVNPLSEETLAPFLNQVKSDLINQMKGYFVEAMNLDLDEFVPSDWQNPGEGRQKDYVDWYAQQSYETQRALSERDPVGTARALKSFRDFETKRGEDRKKVADAKAKKLAKSAQPQSNRQQRQQEALRTEEAAFDSVFK